MRSLPKTVANTTDPASRVMPKCGGFVQGCNAQAQSSLTISSPPSM